jgi:hypothetical protein
MLSVISVIAQTSLILLASGNFFARLVKRQEARWALQQLLPIMIGLYVFGMILPYPYLIYIAIAAIIPARARNRSDIAPLYLVTVMSLPDLKTHLALGSIYLLDADKWLMASIGALIAFFLNPPDREQLRGRYFDVPLLFFFVLEIVQARGNNFTSILRIETDVLFSYIVPYFVLSRSMTRPEHVRKLMIAMSFVGFCMAIVGVYESHRSTLLYNMLSQRAHIFETISSYSHQRGGSLRAAGSLGEATSFGIFLCTTFVATLSLTDIFRNKKCWLIALAVIFAGFYAANTRAAMVGLVVGLLAFDVFRKNYGRLFQNIGIIAAAGLSAVVIAQFSYRMAARLGLVSETSSTSDYRKLLLTRGWEEIKKHPWFGIDPPQVMVALADLRQGEGIIDFVNAYIWYGMTAGIPGMILLFLGFMLMPVRLTMSRKRLGSMIYAREMGASIFAISLFYGLTAGTSGFGGRTTMIVYLLLAAGAALCAMRAPRIPAVPATDARMPLVHAPA